MARFKAWLQKGGEIQLSLGSRILIAGQRVAVNGEIIHLSTLPSRLQVKATEIFETLAQRRKISSNYCGAAVSSPTILEIFYRMYLDGFIVFLEKNKRS
jgi:hypothetical protein